MRVNQIPCPKCGATLKSQAGVPVGQSISCPKCKHRFQVQAEDEPDVVEDDDVVDAEVVEDEAPRRKKARPRDDEEDRPVRKGGKSRKARPRDDDEDEDRPRKKKKARRRDDDEEEGLYSRLKHNVLVRVITLVVLLGILAVVAYLLYEKKKSEKELENAGQPVERYLVGGPGGADVRQSAIVGHILRERTGLAPGDGTTPLLGPDSSSRGA